MARYIAGVRGNRQTSATRYGTAKSGIRAIANGWNLGVRVDGNPANKDDEDVFVVTMTGGTNDEMPDRVIAVIRQDSVRMPEADDLARRCKALAQDFPNLEVETARHRLEAIWQACSDFLVGGETHADRD